METMNCQLGEVYVVLQGGYLQLGFKNYVGNFLSEERFFVGVADIEEISLQLFEQIINQVQTIRELVRVNDYFEYLSPYPANEFFDRTMTHLNYMKQNSLMALENINTRQYELFLRKLEKWVDAGLFTLINCSLQELEQYDLEHIKEFGLLVELQSIRPNFKVQLQVQYDPYQKMSYSIVSID